WSVTEVQTCALPISRSICRARTSGHSRGRSATTWHAGDKHDEGSSRPQGNGIGPDLGTVPRVSRQHDPPATGHDARRGGKHGGLYGVRQGEWDDWNYR